MTDTQRSGFRRKALTLAVSQALLVWSHCQAADIVVDDPTDTATGACTFRQALDSANNDTAFEGCVAGNGADTITFDPAILPASITLNGSQLLIQSDVTVVGPGSDQLTVTGTGHRLLRVSSGQVNLSGLRFSGGAVTGGANTKGAQILNHGTLMLSDSQLLNGSAYSRGGGLYNYGSAVLNQVEVSGHVGNEGAGLGNAGSGTLTVMNSQVQGNTATTASGGIDNKGILSVERSSISGNSAGNAGGGIRSDFGTVTVIRDSSVSGNSADVLGGGIDNSGEMTISNVTVSGNQAVVFGGGLFTRSSATLTLLNSTLSDNIADDGASIYIGGTVNLTNSILANGQGTNECFAGFNSDYVTNLNNLVEDGGCNTNAVGPLSGDPLLGPLSDNGGDTLTHALLAGSPARDAGDNAACPPQDQRGVDRDDGLCDIGAFEVSVASAPIIVNSLGDLSADDGACTLREAIGSANSDTASGATAGECLAGSGSDIIQFDASLSGTITLDEGLLPILSPISLQGPMPPAGPITVHGGNSVQVFNINDQQVSDASVEISRLTISGGSVNDVGGGLVNFEDLTLNEVTFSGNTAEFGGGLDNRGRLSILDSTFVGNTANQRGGAISGYGASISISNSTLVANSATTIGAALNLADEIINLNHLTISDNVGDQGILLGGNTVSMSNSIVSGHANIDCAGTLDVNRYNLIEDGSCSLGAINLIAADPMLLPLASNGGPTQTQLFHPASPVLSSADSALCTSADQRGVMRDSSCDRGAVELRGVDSAPIVVTTTSDVVASDGLCSLREAISSANDDIADGTSGECAQGFGEDVILFDPSLSGTTATLTQGLLFVESPITMRGLSDNSVTVSGGGNSPILFIEDAMMGRITVRISNLTLRDGSGAFVGGAVMNDEQLYLDQVTITANSALYGGGLYNRGVVLISDSTIDGNTATTYGGGILDFGSEMQVSNSTLANNSAGMLGGALMSRSVNLDLVNSTLSGNLGAPGGAVLQADTVIMSNSILAGNEGSDCTTTVTFQSNDFNLIENGASDCEINGVGLVQADPLLGPLQDNGGLTQTLSPMTGSPAIDAGNDASCLSRDQNGTVRPFDGDADGTARCDIGSVEFVIDEFFADGFED